MTPQPLPGLEPEPVLTERQEQALALVREHGPIRSEDLGGRLRELRGGRPSGAEFDASSGREVGSALERAGKARYLRGRGWVVSEWSEPAEPSAQLGPGDPWPEGF